MVRLNHGQRRLGFCNFGVTPAPDQIGRLFEILIEHDMQSLRIVLVIPLLITTACREAGTPAAVESPAKAEPVSSEANLLTVTLTPEARQRLGVATVEVAMRNISAIRLTNGEVVNAPVGATGVPSVSTSDFAGLASRQAAADAELRRTQAALKLARVATVSERAL